MYSQLRSGALKAHDPNNSVKGKVCARLRPALPAACALQVLLTAGWSFAQVGSGDLPPRYETRADGQSASQAIESLKDVPYIGTIRLQIDATDVQRHIFSIREEIPVHGGQPLTLLFPQWTPGDHTANGPLEKLAGLVIRTNGQRLRWTRDPLCVYAFHIEVPTGVERVDLSYQYVGSSSSSTGPALITRTMFDLQWQAAILYPAGYFSRDVLFAPSVTLPSGWQYFSALDGAQQTGDNVLFATTALDTLIDSPLMAGKYAKQVILTTSPVPVFLDVVANDASSLERLPEAAENFRALQTETTDFFQSRHYDHYDHMLWLSDELGPVYYEHHRSGENNRPADFLKQSGPVPSLAFLEHGYVHSWNGMFRRPEDMSTPNLNTAERDSMFWVFEGLTEYWSDVLAVRSGVTSKEDMLRNLASMTASTSMTAGAEWSSLSDVNNAPIYAFRKAESWPTWQRSMFDCYSQGELIWLSVDTEIRKQSKGRRSLDDFARTFFAGDDSGRTTATYTFAQMVAALNQVWPYDWNSYLKERLEEYGTQKSLDGITTGGYQLTFTSRRIPSEDAQHFLDLAFSLGMQLAAGGRIANVNWEGPAFKAGLIPGGTITTVNGMPYSPALVENAITDAVAGPILHLQVKRAGTTDDYSVDWRGGLRQPELTRVDSSPALLDTILAHR